VGVHSCLTPSLIDDWIERNSQCIIISLTSPSFELTILQVIDNSGALLVECVNVLKRKVNNRWGSVGDEIVCVVKSARPISAAVQASATAIKVRRGDVRRAVIVRTRKPVRRPDGRLVRFDDNAAVLLNNKREMLGTRIGGVVSADLRMKGWGKIISLAPKVRAPSVLRSGKLTAYLGSMNSIFHIFTHGIQSLQASIEASLMQWISSSARREISCFTGTRIKM